MLGRWRLRDASGRTAQSSEVDAMGAKTNSSTSVSNLGWFGIVVIMVALTAFVMW